MTLSSLAVKALIGFSLGLNANTSPNQVLGDSLKTKKTSCEVKTQKKSQKSETNKISSKSAKLVKEPDSCGKCGKG